MRLTAYALKSMVSAVGFEVEATDEFTNWYLGLTEDEQLAIDVRVELLAEEGPKLKRPVVGEVVGSRFDPQMKELRAAVGRSVLRALHVRPPPHSHLADRRKQGRRVEGLVSHCDPNGRSLV